MPAMGGKTKNGPVCANTRGTGGAPGRATRKGLGDRDARVKAGPTSGGQARGPEPAQEPVAESPARRRNWFGRPSARRAGASPDRVRR